MSARRKLTINVNILSRNDRDKTSLPALELERLEQETTLVLQEIDHNLSRANAVINEKIFPILTKYAAATSKVWENVGFWKHFMEEAADVEIKTLEEKAQVPHRAEPETAADDISANSSYDKQIEASTPQNQRSRSLFASSQTSGRRTSAYRRISVSPKKQSDQAKTLGDQARLSIIQNFLDSSPTLPEPPVLMSEVGRMTNASSSSAARPLHGAREVGTNDSASPNLDRLLPIQFPALVLTPSASKPNPAQGSSTQRFPNTPTFRSSLQSKQGAESDASPARRTPAKYQDSQDDIGFQVSNNLLNLQSRQDEDSDDPSVPDLQTINLTRSKPVQETEGRILKKGRFADDPENVFLDRRASVAEAHTTLNAEVGNSRSMSQIFEEVLSAGPRDPLKTTETTRTAGKNTQQSEQSAQSTRDATETEDILVAQDVPETEAAVAPEQADTAEEDLSQAPNLSSIEHSVNSSDLGSFLGERWRSISSSLRR